ncbi:MAG: M1 family aminopeptidase, partial [Acidobacteriota bacterium]|nr:M1 family aminopeptidase [Acidobacteriota bacterium]
MILRLIFTTLLLTIACAVVYGQGNSSTDPQQGVPRDLARFRAAHYSNVRYHLTVDVAAGAELMKGSEEIRVTLDGSLDQLVLDWRKAAAKDNQPQARAWDIEVNGREVKDAREVNDHILIPGAYLAKGENVIKLKFESPVLTSGSAVTRYLDREDKSEYIYTLFVPSDASTAFPCFDQPDLKARFQLNVFTLTAWTVISNTSADTVTRNGTNSFWHFPETEPISTYLFAFAAGPFAEFKDETSQIPMRLFVRKSKVEKARKELSEVFRIHRECLAFLADYFNFKYPFPKYDIVLVPEFAYGGMEHAGSTFLREDGVLFPVDPTAVNFAARAELICHEASHQWFGDLVTMRWFDDLWLKEGFATFMAYKAIEKVMPQYNAWKIFYQRTKPGAYSTDVTKGTTPIFQEIPNLSAAKSAYGNIVYLKAPSMLRQAEFFLGADKFQEAIRAFVKEHAFGNAEWSDLVRAFERSSGRKLDEWAAAWVRRRGLADVRVDWSLDRDRAGRINRLVLKQTNVLNEGGTWPMRLKLLLAHESSQPETLTVTISGAETEVKEAIGKPRPDFI